MKKNAKNFTYSVLMTSTIGLGALNLGIANGSYRAKIKLDKETDTKKIEYYEEMINLNKSLIDQQLKLYNSSDIKEKLKKELYDNVVGIPDRFRQSVFESLPSNSDMHKYLVPTKSDLETIKKLELDLLDEPMPGFLFYCKNLEDLTIVSHIKGETVFTYMPLIASVKKFTLDSEIEYYTKDTIEDIFSNMPYIEDLTIENQAVFEPGVLESLKQLKRLEINPSTNCDIDFKKLDHLEELKIDTEEPYDIAIWFNTEEYNHLKENGVKIIFNDGVEEEYLKIAQELEGIVESLNINENSTDDEVLNEVLKYATTHYQYDEDVSESLINGTPRKEGKESASFYKGGWLYGALERDTQICGNYAAFVEAMYDRLYEPEKSYMLLSHNHCWNSIDFDGKRYYVDSTWFDGNEYQYGDTYITSEEALSQDLGRFIHWYKEDPNSNFIKDQEENDTHESHIPTNTLVYAEDGFVKEGVTVTTPITTKETQITTTTTNLTIKTEKIDTSRFEKEKQILDQMYDQDIKRSLKLAALFFSFALLLKIKNYKRIKKELLVEELIKVKRI